MSELLAQLAGPSYPQYCENCGHKSNHFKPVSLVRKAGKWMHLCEKCQGVEA